MQNYVEFVAPGVGAERGIHTNVKKNKIKKRKAKVEYNKLQKINQELKNYFYQIFIIVIIF